MEIAAYFLMEPPTQKPTDNPVILAKSGTQYVATVRKWLSSYCGAHLVKSYSKEKNISDTNWLRYLHHFLSKFG